MKVGWLADDPGYVGGAERTQAEFRSAAPDGVEVISCPAGHVTPGLDRYVIHNCLSYDQLRDYAPMAGAPKYRYHHDMNAGPLDEHLKAHARPIYCSPLQHDRMSGHGPVIPPALDLDRFRRVTNGERKGAVWLGMHPNHPGKGLDLALEWADGMGLDCHDDIPHEKVPELLARYMVFVHLPRAIEPFGRSVVEAWASGCKIVINRNVGARYWIEDNPRGLETASERFWEVVTS